jgi:hypothetical protein
MDSDDFDIDDLLRDDAVQTNDIPEEPADSEPIIDAGTELNDTATVHIVDPANIHTTKETPVNPCRTHPDLRNVDGLDIDDLPPVNAVPDVSLRVRSRPKSSTGYKPRSKMSQRRAYQIFLDCINWYKADQEHVFLIEFLADRGVLKSKLLELSDRYPICKGTYEHILNIQEARLVKKASKEEFHPGFIKFFMNCNYRRDYTPSSDVKQEVSASVKMTPVQITFEEVNDGANKDQH